jgi:DNA transformation protein
MNEFVDYVSDILEQFDVITTRKMFGGYGIYKNGLMFGLIADNELYFKADEEAAEFFAQYNSTPFTYNNGKKLVKMSYWKVSDEVLEDTMVIKKWMDIAYSAAMKGKAKKKS